jgi:hypothetical protein
MKKLAIVLILLLILALISGVVGCGSDDAITPTPIITPTPTPMPTLTPTPTPTPTPPPEADYMTHTDVLNGFSIAYPEDWGTKTLPGVLFALGSTEQCRGYVATFDLYRMELINTTNVEAFFGPMLNDTFSSQERSFIYGEKVGVSGRSAIEWVTTITNADGLPLKEMSFYVLGTRTAWILSFRAVFYCWNEYEDIFQHMVGSFQIL